ncbi:hypothetical protein APY03_0842 [Variovorax sp. WDL1]|nr:hypothetical protein APY03_0842 [Variovorax sp. WDL1]
MDMRRLECEERHLVAKPSEAGIIPRQFPVYDRVLREGRPNHSCQSQFVTPLKANALGLVHEPGKAFTKAGREERVPAHGQHLYAALVLHGEGLAEHAILLVRHARKERHAFKEEVFLVAAVSSQARHDLAQPITPRPQAFGVPAENGIQMLDRSVLELPQKGPDLRGERVPSRPGRTFLIRSSRGGLQLPCPRESGFSLPRLSDAHVQVGSQSGDKQPTVVVQLGGPGALECFAQDEVDLSGRVRADLHLLRPGFVVLLVVIPKHDAEHAPAEVLEKVEAAWLCAACGGQPSHTLQGVLEVVAKRPQVHVEFGSNCKVRVVLAQASQRRRQPGLVRLPDAVVGVQRLVTGKPANLLQGQPRLKIAARLYVDFRRGQRTQRKQRVEVLCSASLFRARPELRKGPPSWGWMLGSGSGRGRWRRRGRLRAGVTRLA